MFRHGEFQNGGRVRYLRRSQLNELPDLRDSMFADRTRQFRDRMGWAVQVDAQGHEHDTYDALDPLYLVWERVDGLHGGSIRYLPTTGPTILANHFAHLLGTEVPRDPRVLECTRFCLAEHAGHHVASCLMLAGGAMMQAFDLEAFVGVIYSRIARVYRLIGSEPEILGRGGQHGEDISVGRWVFGEADWVSLRRRAAVSDEAARLWLNEGHGVIASFLRDASTAATATCPPSGRILLP